MRKVDVLVFEDTDIAAHEHHVPPLHGCCVPERGRRLAWRMRWICTTAYGSATLADTRGVGITATAKRVCRWSMVAAVRSGLEELTRSNLLCTSEERSPQDVYDSHH